MTLAPCREYRGPVDRDGYGRLSLGRERGQVFLHRWVVEQIEDRVLAPDELVLHHCDNPPCFLYDHLYVGTHADNVADRDARGRTLAGDRHPKAKLTSVDVDEIRRLLGEGATHRSLALRFNVQHPAIGKIARGQTWRPQ